MNIFNRKIGYSVIIGSLVGVVSLLGISSFAKESTNTLFNSLLQQAGLELLFSDLAIGLQPATSPIKFIGGGNNYAGALIVTDQSELKPAKTVTFSGTTTSNIICKKQIHGYYFNAARGAGLLPLSNTTLMNTNDGIAVTGGLYTVCGEGNSIFDIIGILSYTKGGVSIGSVIFGVTTYTSTNTYGPYQPGAIKLLGQGGINTINGRFFDTMFGIGEASSANSPIGPGLAGGTSGVNNMINLFVDVYIQGHVGIGQSVETSERSIITNSLVGTKTLLTSTDEILSSDIINTVARNTAKKCRSNTYNTNDVSNNNLGTSKFICIDLKDGILTINNQNIDKLVNKDVVFLNGDVQLDRSIYTYTSLTNPLSIYIPDGNLIFESDIDMENLKGMDSNGFPVNGPGITKGVYMVGNFVVNGLILGSQKAGIYRSIPFKTFIHGKLVSLNTFTTVSDKREKLLTNLLTNRSPTYTELTTIPNGYFKDNQRNASLGDIFSRGCADTTITGTQTLGMGASPLMPVTSGFEFDTIVAVTNIPCPIGQRFPLTIIEKNLSSSFFLK